MRTYFSSIRSVLLPLVVCMSSANAGLIFGSRAIGNSGLGATDANAMIVNPEGIGHVLVVPYFSAQGDNASILSIVNTDPIQAKAVKVRYRGAANADTVFDLTVFLGPNDVWNAVVARNSATGIAQMTSTEPSCTLPGLTKNQTYSFGTSRLNAALTPEEKANQTREGYIEIITMADIPQSSDSASLFRAIAPSGGTARACESQAVLATLNNASDEASAAALGFAAPTGSLRSSWTMINVPQTLTYSGNALALMAVDQATGVPRRGAFTFFPQNANRAGKVDEATADPLLRSNPYVSKSASGKVSTYVSASLPLVKPTFSDLPDLSTPYVTGVADPMAYTAMISKAIAVKSVRNDYATEPTINAATDWIFSMPTKRFSVAFDYIQSKPVYNLMTGANSTEFFSDERLSWKSGKSCTDHVFTFYDRDETAKSAGDNVLATSAYLKLCGMVASVPFGSSGVSSIGANVTSEPTVKRAFVNGWGQVDLGNSYAGTPLLGYSLIKAQNDNASPGVSGNYGMISSHKFLR